MSDDHQAEPATRVSRWKMLFKQGNPASKRSSMAESEFAQGEKARPEKWSLGILSDPQTEEVPGSVLLLSKVSEYNEPLGIRNAPARTSASSLPSPYPPSRSSSQYRRPSVTETKRTSDGKFVLEPQPDDSLNDPLNWAVWRRDTALLSLGFYCMIGGGMTPILAAGFEQVGEEFDVTQPQVALTVGLYMLGLGVGSVVLSPTAILFGKRPVYLVAAICFVLSAVWCASSPNYASLVCARVFQGIAVSSVECLPSATVAEIYFLHEKAYRLGIYTLLLLGGKNLVPLVSAAIIGSLGWRWVFWIVAIVVGFAGLLLFAFVPETFWDRSPRPHRNRPAPRRFSSSNLFQRHPKTTAHGTNATSVDRDQKKKADDRRIHFDASDEKASTTEGESTVRPDLEAGDSTHAPRRSPQPIDTATQSALHMSVTPHSVHMQTGDYFSSHGIPITAHDGATPSVATPISPRHPNDSRSPTSQHSGLEAGMPSAANIYTKALRRSPPKTFLEQLQPWSGRINRANWFKVMLRPFILFAYPGILWSTLVYSLSIGWLIVLSESVAHIYQNRGSYNFTPLQTGLVYISPFIGGVLGTAVAGKVSDLIVRYMSRRNGGIYEPEFRLVMAIPILLTTGIGLMGYGWSAQERDAWIVPTIFFGCISFGCSLGSTTSITFAVDSYRQYAGEALVTLNFSKNVFHGLVFSLFFNRWLEDDGPKTTFVAIGGIQVACLLTTIPMYIYGKRARMWTVRKNFMEKF
ncbi:MFS general substrate transporter [Polychaeton citri CBS 116435]|uniref:MFS general substrate transporter n=1 Tax=Polychaeton citri CBS 116435 TaxID=1314669 RepID=A0A9P4UU04_9PEZI|nr:MFS general substrate transporter [Polychaeton citri CBS 116435]